MDWDKTSKPEFDGVRSKTSEESTRLISDREKAMAQIQQTADEKRAEFKQNAADITARPSPPEQAAQQTEFDAPTLDLTPPVRVVDRSTERREEAAARIRAAAQTRQEEFNTKARTERTSPYIRETTSRGEQDQGDEGMSH